MAHREWLEQLVDATTRLLDELRGRDAPALQRLRSDAKDLHSHLADEIVEERRNHPRLLVFVYGTTLTHGGAATDGAVEKLQDWSDQGAEISYLSGDRDLARVIASANVLRAHGFPPGAVLSRGEGESYDDVVRRAVPDILIEDDCTSTGSHEIAYGQIASAVRGRIRSVIVPEFGGLAHLPANLNTLL